MPNYSYRCQDCQKPFNIELSYQEYDKAKVKCPHCQSQNVQRRLSRVRFARSEESRLESFADPAALAGMEDDPKALGKMMRQMGQEMGGEDLGPEFNEVVGRLESGESPEQIEKDLPDMGGGEFGGDE
jgi:putative FmdB family regulatory protein